jgi:S-layer domain
MRFTNQFYLFGEKMTKNIFNSALRMFVIFMLLLSLFSGAASATSGLKITLVDQTPYPAQPGQQIRFWIQAENIGNNGPLNDVTIQVVSDGVFSASSADSSKTYSTIHTGTKVYHEYIMYVASDAPDGPRDLTVRYKVGNASLWTEQKFTVGIGGIVDTNNRGTLIVESSTSNPEVFKPGDEGIIWVTLKNNATAQTVPTSDKNVYLSNARIQSADLYSKDNIVVKSEAVNDLGIIAPGDNISIPFRVSVPEGTPDGTYLLTLSVIGSSYEYNIKRNIEIKVDAAGIKTIQSKAPSNSVAGTTIEIDIVNNHQGAVRGVTIIPVAEGASFYPTEYFIGEMKPDDLFTAKFNMTQSSRADPNVEFKAVYFNGDNAHEDSVTLKIGVTNVSSSPGILTYIIYLILILLIVGVVAHFYLKKKKNMSLKEYLVLKKNSKKNKNE